MAKKILKNNTKRTLKNKNTQRMRNAYGKYQNDLSSINLDGGATKKTLRAAKTFNGSFLGHIKDEENLKTIGKRVLQSTAGSAAAHGGLAALQGDDPWEAAKTGALRGAFAGAGYQYLRAGAGVNSMQKGFKGFKENVGTVYKAGRDTLRAHSITGNRELRQKMSPYLKQVLDQNARNEMTGGLLGLKTK